MACLSVGWLAWFLFYANSKGTDQPAHLRRLICAFVFALLKELHLNLLIPVVQLEVFMTKWSSSIKVTLASWCYLQDLDEIGYPFNPTNFKMMAILGRDFCCGCLRWSFLASVYLLFLSMCLYDINKTVVGVGSCGVATFRRELIT